MVGGYRPERVSPTLPKSPCSYAPACRAISQHARPWSTSVAPFPPLRTPSAAAHGPRPSCPPRRLRHPRLQPALVLYLCSFMRPPEPVPSTCERFTPSFSALRSARVSCTSPFCSPTPLVVLASLTTTFSDTSPLSLKVCSTVLPASSVVSLGTGLLGAAVPSTLWPGSSCAPPVACSVASPA